jgi:hypothetical protein
MADVGCSVNTAVAYDFLVGKGLRYFQAAGIIGNLQVESPGIVPRIQVMDSNGKPSRGIAMWQPDRWQALIDFASGRDPWSLDVQLDFLWHELQTNPNLGLAPLLASTSIEDATAIFEKQFENPQPGSTSRRIAAAQKALECLSVRPPITPPSRSGVVAAAVGVVALVAAAGYGVYKAMSNRAPEPEPQPRPVPRPRPEPVFPPPPSFRPAPIRPPWRP